jgi:hypothetical protein
LLFLAEITGDFERVIMYWIEQKNFNQALQTLGRQSNQDLFYKYSSILLEHVPEETVDMWLRHPDLNPRDLLPALVKYEQIYGGSHSKVYMIGFACSLPLLIENHACRVNLFGI